MSNGSLNSSHGYFPSTKTYNWGRYTQNFHTWVWDTLNFHSSCVSFPYSTDIHPCLSDCTIAMKKNYDHDNFFFK